MHLLAIECHNVDPFFGQRVFSGDQPVDLMSSGGFGHRTGLALAFAYFREPATGADLYVELLGQRYRARLLNDCPRGADDSRMKHLDRLAKPDS